MQSLPYHIAFIYFHIYYLHINFKHVENIWKYELPIMCKFQ